MLSPERLEIGVTELKELLDRAEAIEVLDVREPYEFATCNIGGRLMPLGVLPIRFRELDPARQFAVICHTGNRSAQAVAFLRRMGFSRTFNVAGGIDAWASEIDPAMPKY